ncbi:MAG: fibronectin type III domain-containing protein [Treponema sp.]|nr:fibronectin type III domain-containing protein [Treponema sp.]
MKRSLIFIFTLYIFIFVSVSVFAFDKEKTIILGGSSGWKSALNLSEITEAASLRQNSVLVLSSAPVSGYSAAKGVMGNFSALNEPVLDMSISFDEKSAGLYKDITGNYRVTASPETEAADRRYSRSGAGAALFNGGGLVKIEPNSRRALFAPGNYIGDFTVEFWLYPLNLENGEVILSWNDTRNLNGKYLPQKIDCIAEKNRLKWSFINFFSNVNIEFTGNYPVVPKTWTHHLVRYDAVTGMIEYIVNGTIESIVYTGGREKSGSSYPVTGSAGVFLLCERFTGLIDEFKVHSVFAGRSAIQKFPSAGRLQTGLIDLGYNQSVIKKIDASGGKTNGVNSEYRENGRFRFSDDAEMSFFVRSADNPYLIDTRPWQGFTPGAGISGIQGRYVQIAADFYPSADGETSPYLEQLRLVYAPKEPPMPPRNLTAVAVDGGVLLRWKSSPSVETSGYLVYYSPVRGELFGNEAIHGASPIDAGNTNSLFIDGLKNGTLYYFRVASYDRTAADDSISDFSAEVTARPLAGLLLSGIQDYNISEY